MSDTNSTPNYQEILDKYAADLQAASKTIPDVPETPETPTSLETPKTLETTETPETPTSLETPTLSETSEVSQILTPAPESEPIIPPVPTPTPTPTPTSTPAPDPIIEIPPQRPEPIVVTPIDSPLPEIKPKENNFFKYLFFVSLIIFLGVLAAVIYSFINTQKPLSKTDATPTVEPSLAPAVVCKINDQEYALGANFPASDGCNTCTCNSDTSISCTEKACDISPTKSATTSANQYKNTKYKYSLTFPSSWLNKYNTTETSDSTIFTYKDNPDTKTLLFSINVYSKDKWEEIVAGPHGGATLIKEDNLNDRVFTYTFPLDTTFEGQKANDYGKMTADVKQIISTIKFF